MAGDRGNSRFDHGIATLQEARRHRHARRERHWRHGGLLLMGVVVVAALAGVFGGRQATVTTSTGPVTVSVEYPQITRPGIEAPLRIEVRRDGGFDGPVAVAIEGDIFDRLDFHSWFPTPSAERADGGFVIVEFDPPSAGDILVARLDAHAQTTQWPSADRYTIALPDDQVEVEIRMWVMP